MKSILSLFSVLILVSLMVNSCADDSTTPSGSKNFTPGDAGSYWIYHDTLTSNDTVTTATDSTTAGPKETVKGKSASKFSVYLDGTFKESYYRYGTDGKVYALPSEQIPAEIKMIIPDTLIPQDWVVIADDNASSEWTMFTLNLDDIKLQLPGMGEVVIKGTVTVKGKKGVATSLTVSGTSYNTQEFITTTGFNGTAKISGFPAPINFTVESKAYYADKVGLVKSETPKKEILVSSIPLFTVEQNTRMLHHFHLVSSVQ